uniref:Uncharacterized protein n=1 Tax=Oryza punctata TaxID=4537 RepID=A0A0E0LUE4_ORYPU
MAPTTRLMALASFSPGLHVVAKSVSASHELVHEQANDLNEDDMDTAEARTGDENKAHVDDKKENYMDFEYRRH